MMRRLEKEIELFSLSKKKQGKMILHRRRMEVWDWRNVRWDGEGAGELAVVRTTELSPSSSSNEERNVWWDGEEAGEMLVVRITES